MILRGARNNLLRKPKGGHCEDPALDAGDVAISWDCFASLAMTFLSQCKLLYAPSNNCPQYQYEKRANPQRRKIPMNQELTATLESAKKVSEGEYVMEISKPNGGWLRMGD